MQLELLRTLVEKGLAEECVVTEIPGSSQKWTLMVRLTDGDEITLELARGGTKFYGQLETACNDAKTLGLGEVRLRMSSMAPRPRVRGRAAVMRRHALPARQNEMDLMGASM